jgi:hypothetical protein
MVDYANIPLMLILNKNTTYSTKYVNQKSKPQLLYKKGDLLGLIDIGKVNPPVYDYMHHYAGSQSVFVTDKFSNLHYFKRLNKHYNLNLEPPTKHQSHFNIFKQLCQTDSQLQKWQAKLLLFPRSWMSQITTNKKYRPLFNYLHEQETKRLNQFLQVLYKIALNAEKISYELKKNVLKYDLPLFELLEQIMLINNQTVFAFRPVENEDAFPIHRMQEILETTYNRKRWALFMHLAPHDTLCQKPVYFSLNYLHLAMRDEAFFNIRSNLTYLKKIQHVMDKFQDKKSILPKNNHKIHYFHSLIKHEEEGISHPQHISNDPYLSKLCKEIDNPYKSSFWKGLIQISPKI